MSIKLTLLDTAPIAPGDTARDSIQASVALAQQAEKHKFHRVWYAEHHNMPAIASSATSVLISHVGARTESIRLGAGGVMLPNHAPLVIAEQFGTLEAMYPGRIDLGLGRAAGSDAATMRALRRTHAANDQFPQDVRELQSFLGPTSARPGVRAVPGENTSIPMFILGSSLYGAKLAASFSLPYAFASHFAPQHLMEALATYRSEFQPSAELAEPYVMATLNVIGADSNEEAEAIALGNRREFVRGTIGKGRDLTDDDVDDLLRRGAGSQFESLFQYTATGTAAHIRTYFQGFQELTGADELVTSHLAPAIESRLRSVAIAAEAAGLTPSAS